MKHGGSTFVDTGAFIALALTRDPLHGRAVAIWERILETGQKLHTSIPIVLETFTFLERNAAREVALVWKDSLREVARMRVHECTARDLEVGWSYFKRRDLHKLSAVDATSFVIMKRLRVSQAFTFDHHFAAVGFRMLG